MKRKLTIHTILAAILISTTLLCLCPGCGKNRVEIPSITMAEISEHRPTFTADNLPNYAVFNSVVDHPIIGDERQFVRVYDSAGNEYIDSVELQPNQLYEVRIYFVNDATDASKKLINTYCTASFPDTIAQQGSAVITGVLKCDADTFIVPEKTDDSISITCSTELSLKYIVNSAQQYSTTGTNKLDFTKIDPEDLFGNYASIGYLRNDYNNTVLSGTEPQHVTFTLFTEPTANTDSSTS